MGENDEKEMADSEPPQFGALEILSAASEIVSMLNRVPSQHRLAVLDAMSAATGFDMLGTSEVHVKWTRREDRADD